MPLIPVQKQIEDSIPGIEELYITARNFIGVNSIPINSNFIYNPFTFGGSHQQVVNEYDNWIAMHCPNFNCGLSIKPVTDENGTYWLHTIQGEIPAPTDELIVLLGNIQNEGCWSMAKPYNEPAYMIAEDNCFGTLEFDVTTGEGPASGTRLLTFTIEQKMLVPAQKFSIA